MQSWRMQQRNPREKCIKYTTSSVMHTSWIIGPSSIWQGIRHREQQIKKYWSREWPGLQKHAVLEVLGKNKNKLFYAIQDIKDKNNIISMMCLSMCLKNCSSHVNNELLIGRHFGNFIYIFQSILKIKDCVDEKSKP